MNDDRVMLRLTPQQMDYVANVLAQRPWAEANALMVEIQQQVAAQQTHSRAAPNGHDVVDTVGH